MQSRVKAIRKHQSSASVCFSGLEFGVVEIVDYFSNKRALGEQVGENIQYTLMCEPLIKFQRCLDV